jgi:hypothetical protein
LPNRVVASVQDAAVDNIQFFTERAAHVGKIVDRPDQARFEVLPKRWIVKRTIAWLAAFAA